MATRQPEWEFVANLGDETPLDYGGYFVYRDKTGVYPEEAEFWREPDEEDGDITVYQVVLDRLQMVGPCLVPFDYDESWPYPAEKYDEWFHRDLSEVADFIGSTKEELEGWFTSADPLDRAQAYRVIGDYYGWENLDQYPITLTRKEAEERYAEELKR